MQSLLTEHLVLPPAPALLVPALLVPALLVEPPEAPPVADVPAEPTVPPEPPSVVLMPLQPARSSVPTLSACSFDKMLFFIRWLRRIAFLGWAP